MSIHSISNLDKFSEALNRLEIALAQPDSAELSIDGTIQRFEFCFELAWKAIKDILLQAEGIDAKSPKSALKEAYALKWLENETLWLQMLDDRNNSSHTYDEKLAAQIYHRVKQYYPKMRELLKLLQTKQTNA